MGMGNGNEKGKVNMGMGNGNEKGKVNRGMGNGNEKGKVNRVWRGKRTIFCINSNMACGFKCWLTL